MEEILFQTEEVRDRREIADLFRTVADRLAAGESITFTDGDETVELDPPDHPTLEVKAEREGSGESAELSVEFELEWDEHGSGDAEGGLQIG